MKQGGVFPLHVTQNHEQSIVKVSLSLTFLTDRQLVTKLLHRITKITF